MFNDSPQKTYLFSLRLWQVATSEGEHEWRGKLQLLPAGEAAYFQGQTGLITQLGTILANVESCDSINLEKED